MVHSRGLVSRFIPGTVWALQQDELSIDNNAKIARQVGYLLTRCTLGLDSSAIVNRYIIPRLNRIIAKADMPQKMCSRICQLCKAPRIFAARPQPCRC